jgi:hypothetical protein
LLPSKQKHEAIPIKPITIFAWQYYGWDNHTPYLFKALDAAEESRKFKTLMFVDIRIRPSGRAKGFKGSAFKNLVGEQRYLAMKDLGNEKIISGSGPAIQIAKPAAAKDLLELAIKLSKDKQRLLFFCSCEFNKFGGKPNCHRCTVAGLLIKKAKKQGVSIQVVEWPGGEPKNIKMEIAPKLFGSINKRVMNIPLPKDCDLAEIAGLPWGTIATFRCNDQQLHRIVGPAIRHKGNWALPVKQTTEGRVTNLVICNKESEKLRKLHGYLPSYS